MGQAGSKVVGRRGWLAIGGLTAAAGLGLALTAPAFACSPLATLAAKPARGEVGTTVSLNGSGFTPNGNGIDVKWGGPNGRLLTTTSPGGTGVFTTSITVPADAKVAYYQLSAVQTKPDGNAVTASFAYQVLATQPKPVIAAQTQTSPETPPPAAPAAAPVVQPPTPGQAPAGSPAAPHSPTGVVASRPGPPPPTPGPPPAASLTPAAAPASAPAGAVTTPDVAVSPPAPASLGQTLEPLAPVAPLTVTPPLAVGAGNGLGAPGGGRSGLVLIPLILVGLTLFSAGAAAAVHELRQKRTKVGA